MTAGAAPPTDWRDLPGAAGAAVSAVVVYVRTLAPGLVGVLDTPMFQFIGRVLGVAHNPGYPLYVLLTFPFSYLPIGSLRVSHQPVFGVAGRDRRRADVLLARRLGCRRLVALVAALGLAFGEVFWSQAVIAEVYTLHAAIVAGVLLALMVWAANRPRGVLLRGGRAVCCRSWQSHDDCRLRTGHRDLRRCSRIGPSRALAHAATTAVILVVGLLQYVFILIRSLDPDAYVESRATTVAALARRHDGRPVPRSAVRVRLAHGRVRSLPFLFERVIVPELTLPALGACGGGRAVAPAAAARRGAAVAARDDRDSRVRRELLGGRHAGVRHSGDAGAVACSRPSASSASRDWIDRARFAPSRSWRPSWGGVLAVATLLVPGWLLAVTSRQNDQSREYTSADVSGGALRRPSRAGAPWSTRIFWSTGW